VPALAPLGTFLILMGDGFIYTTICYFIDKQFTKPGSSLLRYQSIALSAWLLVGDFGSILGANSISFVRDALADSGIWIYFINLVKNCLLLRLTPNYRVQIEMLGYRCKRMNMGNSAFPSIVNDSKIINHDLILLVTVSHQCSHALSPLVLQKPVAASCRIFDWPTVGILYSLVRYQKISLSWC